MQTTSGRDQQRCTRASKKLSPFLPPCRVCGGEASGFHYGVNACNACKAFFKRSISRKMEYACITGKLNCEVDQKKQTTFCALCRHNKCLHFGMSMAAIKTGRYNHMKKTSDILEVVKLRKLKEHGDTGNTRVPDKTFPDVTKSNGALPTHCGKSTTESEVTRLIDILTEAHTKLYTLSDPGNAEETVKQEEYSFTANCQSKVWTTSFLDESKFIKWHASGITFNYIWVRRRADGVRVLKEMTHLLSITKDENSDSQLTTETHAVLRHAMVTKITGDMEMGIRKLISFAKSVPGFLSLPLNDRVNLVKVGRMDTILLNAYPYVNQHANVVTGSSRRLKYHVCELTTVLKPEYLKNILTFIESMKGLKLTFEERVVLQAITFTFADRCELQEPQKVEDMQWKMVCCLLNLLETNHPNDPFLFARIISQLVRMRSIATDHVHFLNEMRLEDSFSNNALLYETV